MTKIEQLHRDIIHFKELLEPLLTDELEKLIRPLFDEHPCLDIVQISLHERGDDEGGTGSRLNITFQMSKDGKIIQELDNDFYDDNWPDDVYPPNVMDQLYEVIPQYELLDLLPIGYNMEFVR